MPNHLILVSGETSTGKSASLRNMKRPEGVFYLCCESGKDLPFKDSFGMNHTVTHPDHVNKGIAKATAEGYHTVVIDTLTYLMDMFESQNVLTSTNTMKAWSDYAQFFKRLMQDTVAKSSLNFVVMAHTRVDIDENTAEKIVGVPIKGALKNNGIESYFSVVISTKKIKLNVLKNYENDLLHINEEDEITGYKHVFQTRITKQTVGDRIRSPMGLFSINQTFIDNDIDILFNYLDEYYDKPIKYFDINKNIENKPKQKPKQKPKEE